MPARNSLLRIASGYAMTFSSRFDATDLDGHSQPEGPLTLRTTRCGALTLGYQPQPGDTVTAIGRRPSELLRTSLDAL